VREQKEVALYDDLGANYDLMIDWKGRLENEMPFFERLFEQKGVRRVLDSACATGMHTIALAGKGYEAIGADPSQAMIEKARANAAAAGVDVKFVQAAFGELEEKAGGGFDAVICLGNSLPHITSDDELRRTLLDMQRGLNPGGVLVIQNRNYDKIWPEKIKYMPLNTAEFAGKEILFFRMLEFHETDMTFSIVTFVKQAGQWTYNVSSTNLRPLFRDQMNTELQRAGFGKVDFYGDYKFAPFTKTGTMDLIVVAEKSG
jgi:glycine/sarcosine N-methyltransferase